MYYSVCINVTMTAKVIIIIDTLSTRSNVDLKYLLDRINKGYDKI